MDREQFLHQVSQLREEGKSIRAISLELNVHRSTIERALKALARRSKATKPAVHKPQANGGISSHLFVGRQRELAELKQALEGSLSGLGRLVMLVGEPGIGKTRIAEELALVARQRGAHVLWGRCPEERGAPTYWPWVQSIRSWVLEQDPDALRWQMGSGAADIAQIIPEVQERLPDLTASARIDDPDQARFRLFDSFASFLKRASQHQPLVLILDNLHWADPTSLRLLEFVAPELADARILVLGTYRDIDVPRGHFLFRTLGELTRQHLYQRFLLRGLARAEVGQVMENVGAMALPRELVATVHEHTEGNPLFVREVVRLLAEEELLVPEHLSDLKEWNFRVPEGIQEVIGRRLERLSKECNRVLTFASVIGRDFNMELIQEIVQKSQEELLEVLDEAVAARIIEELPSQVGHYKFCHGLIQQTLAVELSSTRKVQLHARIAQTLEELYGDGAQVHASELAYHFNEAEAVSGTAKVVHYSRLAGERALAAYAFEEALAHFQRGLAAKEGLSTGRTILQGPATEAPTDAETADLLFGLGRAQASTYQMVDALASLSRAFEYYASTGNAEAAVALVTYPYQGSLNRRMSELHLRALKLLPSDSHDAGRLLAVSGLALGTAGNYDGAKNAFIRGLAIARREKSISLELLLLVNIAQVDMFHLRWQESLEHSLQAIRLSEEVNELTPSLRGHYCAGNALLQFGNPGEAQRHSDSLLDVSAKLNDRLWLTRADLFAHRLSHLMGDFETARNFSDRAVAISPSYVSFLAWRIQMEYQLGEFSQGQYYIDQLLEVIRQVRPEPSEDGFLDLVIPVVAQITGSSDRLEIAERTAHAILSSPSANPDRVQCARLGLALLSVQQGDATSAAEQYAYLESSQGQMAKAGAVSIPRVLGLLAQTIGQPELAASHFKDALAFCRKAGYQPELAWTCFDYATFLYNRHEHKRALLLLSEAVKICAELGMRPLMDRVNSLRESVYAQRPNIPKYPVGLTERQVQILRLIAEGKTNREIANDLVLSERTVHRHVAEIYAKIGARNRAEATVFSLSQLDPVNQSAP